MGRFGVKPAYMRLYLIRHGQTAWNLDERAQGHTDIPLDEVGLAQAEALRARFSALRVPFVVSSDLARAAQTAKPLAEAIGAELRLEPALRERSFGDLEGESYASVAAWCRERAGSLGIHYLEVRPPGGESPMDQWNRLAPVQEMLERAVEDTAVVSHGGTTGLLLARLIRGNPETAHSFRLDNGSVTELQRRPDGYWRILRINCVEHLENTHGCTWPLA